MLGGETTTKLKITELKFTKIRNSLIISEPSSLPQSVTILFFSLSRGPRKLIFIDPCVGSLSTSRIEVLVGYL